MDIPEIFAPHAIEPAYKLLKNYLEQRANAIEKYSNDELLQMSWMFFMIKEINGKMKILSPEFGVMPINFIDDCSDGLNLVVKQKYLVESFVSELSGCNYRQSALVIKDIDKCNNVFMNRLGCEEQSESGWYFGAEDTSLDANNPENLEFISLWELFCRYPLSGDFFLLPAGWQVVLADTPIVLNDFSEAKYQKDSFYEQKYIR